MFDLLCCPTIVCPRGEKITVKGNGSQAGYRQSASCHVAALKGAVRPPAPDKKEFVTEPRQ